MTDILFSNFIIGQRHLTNRVVMSPMTRSRAIGNIPNALMAEHYAQRASAGLIITEGTAPSANALGYANIPGLFTQEQMTAWKATTEAVHQKQGTIFVQLMHTGRMGNPKYLPANAELIAPSAIPAMGKAIKNTQRANDYFIPREMTLVDIEKTQEEFVQAAKYAIAAGFDGVELHGANEHIIEQFLSLVSNQRHDAYGGSIENRCRFALETIQKVGEAIGFDKVAIRLSPFGANSWEDSADSYAVFDYLSKALNTFGLAYLHHADHSAMGGNNVPIQIKQTIRANFKGPIILTGGFNKATAEEALQLGIADLIGFGRPFIGNPDLVERMKHNWPINADLDVSTFYTAEAKGYTDYPKYIDCNLVLATRTQFTLQNNLFIEALKDLSDEASNTTFSPKLNSIKWVAGHIVNTRMLLYSIISNTPSNTTFSTFFGKGSSNVITTKTPTIEHILQAWEQVSNDLLTALNTIPEQALLAKPPFQTSIPDKTLLGLIAYLAVHEAHHIGQISILRRLLE